MSQPPAGAHDAIAAALAAYDVGDVLALAPVPGEHRGRPCVATTSAGRFLVTVLAPRLASVPAVQLRHAFVAHLALQGTRVPSFLKTRTSEAVARTAALTIEVQEFVEGQPLRGGDSADAIAAGEALAALHQAGSGFRPSSSAAGRDALAIDDELALLHRMEQQVRTYLPAPEIIEQMFHVKHCLLDSARALADADLPVGMIHGDFRPGNLLRDGEGAVWVTDFDACRWAPLLLDVADLTGAFGREALAAYGQRRPLTEAERSLAPTAGRMASIRRGLAGGMGVETIDQRLAGEPGP